MHNELDSIEMKWAGLKLSELDELDWNGLSGVWTGACRRGLNEKDIVDI